MCVCVCVCACVCVCVCACVCVCVCVCVLFARFNTVCVSTHFASNGLYCYLTRCVCVEGEEGACVRVCVCVLFGSASAERAIEQEPGDWRWGRGVEGAGGGGCRGGIVLTSGFWGWWSDGEGRGDSKQLLEKMHAARLWRSWLFIGELTSFLSRLLAHRDRQTKPQNNDVTTEKCITASGWIFPFNNTLKN